MLLSGIVFDFYIPVIIFIKIVDGLFHLLLNPVPLPGAFDPVAAYQEQKLFQKEGEQILRHTAGTVYPLCIEGKPVDSPGVAKRLAGPCSPRGR